MIKSAEIRQAFLDFFKSKQHQIVSSAPLVVKDDPTLMFTNAGMNQFKNIFLGNSPAKEKRIANTQKCLRVSGKHNDLEEVGHDTYHHTMFEMLGNWSFGDYFKKEAIEWAWALLTEIYKIPKERIYITVFAGDTKDNLLPDTEAIDIWKKYVSEDRILPFGKKDNFWEMGDTGPCGPCSEIHVDIRSTSERNQISGKEIVNTGHPLVIEIWNLVFIQFNRLKNGSLESLPDKHVDTGMGFERLCMILQNVHSNYDTDVFQPTIREIEKISNTKYGDNAANDIAMRVIADHIRAIAFAIVDGQLPSNAKAGYVIRRILRRAVRYGYSFLGLTKPSIYKLIPVLAKQFENVFPEMKSQQDLVMNVIKEEEASFLRTLDKGIQKFQTYVEITANDNKLVDGVFAFELLDTFGFPIDLTQLLAREMDWSVNMEEFQKCLEEQKNRSRQAGTVDTSDWVILHEEEGTNFIGYENTEADIHIVKYRNVKTKGNEQFQLVFNTTPFYPEGGGQVGDKGFIEADGIRLNIIDTRKENNLIIHITEELPLDVNKLFKAHVFTKKRHLTENNHTATHLLHKALREVLGKHVEQKGSLVNEEYLRFDFSHFAKVSDEEIEKIEKMVNHKIRENISLQEHKYLPMEKAKAMGAMALFGEKYGEQVRVIQFGKSVELCGGTHAKATGQIGLFKITSENAVASGIRRIEAITADKAEEYMNNQLKLIKEVKQLLKNPKDVEQSLKSIIEENSLLTKKIEEFTHLKAQEIKRELIGKQQKVGNVNMISSIIDLESAEEIKNIAFELKNQLDNLFLVMGATIKGKPQLTVMLSDNLVKEKSLHAGNIIKTLAKEIQGGGGGQAFYATAGGNDASGLERAVKKAKEMII
jgi:alanyl-tRNA synthetase